MIGKIVKWVLMTAGVLFLAIVAIAVMSDREKRDVAPATVGQPGGTVPRQPPALAAPVMPADQAAFIAAVEASIRAYRAAANDMVRGGERAKRAQSLCATHKALAVRNWIGWVETLSSNNDGRGVLAVRIARDVTVKTWNNALSDMDDRTLLDPASAVFQAASAMRRGTAVRFSGSFLRSDTDCFREGSVTQDGSMRDPEFIFRFTALTATE